MSPDEVHVGDIVCIRGWDDMALEFGVDADGDILTPHAYFVRNMRKYCGMECEVVGAGKLFVELKSLDPMYESPTDDFAISTHMIERSIPIDPVEESDFISILFLK